MWLCKEVLFLRTIKQRKVQLRLSLYLFSIRPEKDWLSIHANPTEVQRMDVFNVSHLFKSNYIFSQTFGCQSKLSLVGKSFFKFLYI